MYCRNCGIKLTEDSKFCHECGVQTDIIEPKKKRTKEKDNELSNEIYELFNLIEQRRQNVFQIGIDEDIANKLKNKVISTETGELLIKNYSSILKRDIIEDLKSLSSNYDNIKTYLSIFIDFGIVEGTFPHKYKSSIKIDLRKPTPTVQNITTPNEKSGGKTKFNGCLTIVGVFLLLAIIISFFLPDETADKEKVYNSELDASVEQVERYLKTNLNDPDSYEGIEWSKVQITESDPKYKYYVRHKYRAKNSFGGYVVEHQIFYLDMEGNIVDVKDFD